MQKMVWPTCAICGLFPSLGNHIPYHGAWLPACPACVVKTVQAETAAGKPTSVIDANDPKYRIVEPKPVTTHPEKTMVKKPADRHRNFKPSNMRNKYVMKKLDAPKPMSFKKATLVSIAAACLLAPLGLYFSVKTGMGIAEMERRDVIGSCICKVTTDTASSGYLSTFMTEESCVKSHGIVTINVGQALAVSWLPGDCMFGGKRANN